MSTAITGQAGTPSSSSGWRLIQTPATIPRAASARHRHLRRRLPHQPQGDQAEGDGERQVRDPDGDAQRDGLAGLAVHLEQAHAAQREHRGNHGPDKRRDHLGDVAEPILQGASVPVARASSLPSRAAIAAPTRPTMSVRCEVKGAAPGIPVPNSRRSTTSARGRTMTPSAASVAMPSSTPREEAGRSRGRQLAHLPLALRIGVAFPDRQVEHVGGHQGRRASSSSACRPSRGTWPCP